MKVTISASNPFAPLCDVLGPLNLSSPEPRNKTPVGAVLLSNESVRTKNPQTVTAPSPAAPEGTPAVKAALVAGAAASSTGDQMKSTSEGMALANSSGADSIGKARKKNRNKKVRTALASFAPSTPLLSAEDLLPIGYEPGQQSHPKVTVRSGTVGDTYKVAYMNRRRTGGLYRDRWASVPQGYRFNPPICGNPKLLKPEARRKYKLHPWAHTQEGNFRCPNF